MKGTTRRMVCALVAAGWAWHAASGAAAIVGGDVTGGTSGGVFELLDPPPALAGPDAFESPNLVAFDEQQDLVLTTQLSLGTLTLGAGSTVSSHYVAFDPAVGSTLQGFVDFDEPILAIIGGAGGLDATESLFGLPAVDYSVAAAIGPDEGPGMMGDEVIVSPVDANRLLLSLGANSPGDQLRVLTGVAVPEPGSIVPLTLGALAMAWPRRGRRLRGLCRRRR
ncbi:MAG: hypothetical protein AAGF31_07010 [Planctomycetota bacterium]